MTDTQELAYKRKAKLRKKHRKVRVELVSDMTNLKIAVRKSRKGKEGKKGGRGREGKKEKERRKERERQRE